MNIKEAINRVLSYKDLTEKETRSVFKQIMEGKVTPSQIAAFIVALRMKGETVDEITGAAMVMREKSLRIKVEGEPVLDTCGTGGTGSGVINVSTIAAFVLAGCGIRVAKHGNRAATSKCGSADVLEELGVDLDASLRYAEKCVRELNVGFLFAPSFHKAMRYASGTRKEIGVRTIFNVLGPLSNPAAATNQIMGVYDAELTDTIAKVLKKLGTKRAYVVHGMDNLDEVTITGKTKVSELKGGKVRTYFLKPSDFGVKKANSEEIKGGTVKQNAKIVRDILSGKKGPKRDIVLVNSAIALMASGKAKDIKSGMKLAKESIDSGAAMEKLGLLIKVTKKGKEGK